MNRFLAVLRAVGILFGIWAILLATGWITSSLPRPWEGTDADDDDIEEEPDAGTAQAESPDAAAVAEAAPDASAVAVAQPDGGIAAADGSMVAEAPTLEAVPIDQGPLRRHRVCGPDVLRPTVSIGQVVGDPRPEILVGCGNQFVLLALERDGDVLLPIRVASFETTSSTPNVTMQAARGIAADVDGDSTSDLVLPYYGSAQGGATRGGALYIVRRLDSGGFDAANNLGALAAVAVDAAAIDGNPGLDLVAVNRGDVLSNRPSEVWAFTGGASPNRSALLRTGRGGSDVVAVDLDGDEKTDVVVVAEEDARVDVFYGDGTGRFPRSSTVAVAGGTEVLSVDLDRDGNFEVVVVAEALQLLGAGAAEALEPRPIPAPQGMFEVSTRDVDNDGYPDLVGIAAGALIYLRQAEPLTFEVRPLLTLRELRVAAYAIGDLDADGRTDAATLAVEASGAGGWELVLVRGLPREGELVVATDVAPVRDAPLVLTVPLQ